MTIAWYWYVGAIGILLFLALYKYASEMMQEIRTILRQRLHREWNYASVLASNIRAGHLAVPPSFALQVLDLLEREKCTEKTEDAFGRLMYRLKNDSP